MDKFVEKVREDVVAFLKNNNSLLYNERDLQMHLAVWLKNQKNVYDDVEVEYYVPKSELKDCDSDLYLDIVIRKGDNYCPIELKYKTKEIDLEISCFDEKIKNKVKVLKNQGAQNLGKYDFWKDIRRIELVYNRFEKVKGGLVIFLTNDKNYKKESRKDAYCSQFDMTDGVTHNREKHWNNQNSRCSNKRKSFDVDRKYKTDWEEMKNTNETFYFCIIAI